MTKQIDVPWIDEQVRSSINVLFKMVSRKYDVTDVVSHERTTRLDKLEVQLRTELCAHVMENWTPRWYDLIKNQAARYGYCLKNTGGGLWLYNKCGPGRECLIGYSDSPGFKTYMVTIGDENGEELDCVDGLTLDEVFEKGDELLRKHVVPGREPVSIEAFRASAVRSVTNLGYTYMNELHLEGPKQMDCAGRRTSKEIYTVDIESQCYAGPLPMIEAILYNYGISCGILE